jgi:hypothetical protein
MPKRPTGQGNAVLQMGRTKHQRQADDLLTAHGFVFQRRTGHGANLYHHPDGRKQVVNGTPQNPAGEYARIKREIRGTTTKGTDVSTTPQDVTNPVTLYVSMSDPFLLKQPKSRLEIAARQQALAGWVKRVLERHAPVKAMDLQAAALQMGFKERQIREARLAAGAVAFTIPGASVGQGKGSSISWAALPHQVPEDASLLGRKRDVQASNGVAAVREEEPAGMTISPPDAVTTTVPGEHFRQELASPAPGDGGIGVAPVSPEDDTPATPAPTTPAAVSSENRDGVAAAAQLLLGELGVKMPGEEARQGLRDAMASVRATQEAAARAMAALERALESLQ